MFIVFDNVAKKQQGVVEGSDAADDIVGLEDGGDFDIVDGLALCLCLFWFFLLVCVCDFSFSKINK